MPWRRGDPTLARDLSHISAIAGANLKQVAALPGHISLETTRLYTALSGQNPAQVAEKLEG